MSRFDLGDNIRKPKTVPATVEGFYERVDKAGRICAELADILEQHQRGELTKDEYKAKKAEVKLGDAFYTPHAHFAKGYKSNEGEPVDSGKAIIDLDGCPNFAEIYARQLMGRERELGINMVNRSVSGTGGHVLFDIPEGLDRQQAQAWLSHEMGDVDYDKAVHELERAVYLPCREYILYIDEDLMFGDELHPAKLTEEVIRKYVESETQNSEKANTNDTNLTNNAKTMISVDPSPRALVAFEETLAMTGLDLETLNKEGVRHNTLKLMLPTLCQMMPQEELLGVLALRMPDYSKEDDCHKLVSNFYEKYVDPYRPMNLKQKEVFLRSLKAEEQQTTTYSGLPAEPKFTTMQSSLSEIYACERPPEMPDPLPRLIRLLTRNLPQIYKPTGSHSCFPPLGVHLHKVQFLYTDNTLHEATLMNCLMAGTSSGKGCIDEMINRIMADIRRRDAENERRLDEYNTECNRKGANKASPERPDNLIIQEIHSDVTHAAFVQRMSEAQERFLYFKLNEIELFDKLKGTGGQQFVIMCQAFDPGNRYGQTRASSQSVNATVTIRFNWNAAGTIGAVKKYFSRVLTKGPISRINFCTIPEQEIGAKQPVFGIYDEKFDAELKPYIDNLNAAQGLIICKQAQKLSKRLMEECAEFASLSQDRVYWSLSLRANLIAYLKACVLYVANGCKWEKSIEDFIRWSLHYDLWCKMRFFAEDIRNEDYRSERVGKRGPRNMLELLPETFTIDDAIEVRRKQGKPQKGTIDMIRMWGQRGYIEQITDNSFKNLRFTNNGQKKL